MLRQVTGAGERRELFDGPGVIPLGPLDQGQGEAVARRGNVLVAAEPGKELAEASDGKGIVLLVVGLACAGKQHLGRLLRRHLGVKRRSGAGQEGQHKEGPPDGWANAAGSETGVRHRGALLV